MIDIKPNIESYQKQGFDVDFSNIGLNLEVKVSRGDKFVCMSYEGRDQSEVRATIHNDGINIIDLQIQKAIKYINEANI